MRTQLAWVKSIQIAKAANIAPKIILSFRALSTDRKKLAIVSPTNARIANVMRLLTVKTAVMSTNDANAPMPVGGRHYLSIRARITYVFAFTTTSVNEAGIASSFPLNAPALRIFHATQRTQSEPPTLS